MGADDLDHLRVGPRPRPLVLFFADLDDAEPAIAAVGVEDAGARHTGCLGIDLIAGRFARQRETREVGAPVFVQQHGQGCGPHHLDAGRAPCLAASAVAGQQVARVPVLALAGLDRADLGHDSLLGLLEAHELGGEADLRQVRMLDDAIDLLLDGVLRHQALPGRRLAEIGLGPRAADLAPGDAFDLDEHVGIVLQAALADALLDAPLAEDLHGAHPAAARLGMVGRGRAFLDDHRVDAEAVEQQAHRQPDRPAADDQDGCPARPISGVAHAVSSFLSGPSLHAACYLTRICLICF